MSKTYCSPLRSSPLRQGQTSKHLVISQGTNSIAGVWTKWYKSCCSSTLFLAYSKPAPRKKMKGSFTGYRYHKLMLKGLTMEPSACTWPAIQWASLLSQRTKASNKWPYMIVIMIPSTKQLKISTDYLPPISSFSLFLNALPIFLKEEIKHSFKGRHSSSCSLKLIASELLPLQQIPTLPHFCKFKDTVP